MQRTAFPAAAILTLGLFLASPGWARTWKDAYGRSLEAEFVSLSGETVTLRKRDGSLLEVEVRQLSEADRQFVRNRAEKDSGRTDQTKGVRVVITVDGQSQEFTDPRKALQALQKLVGESAPTSKAAGNKLTGLAAFKQAAEAAQEIKRQLLSERDKGRFGRGRVDLDAMKRFIADEVARRKRDQALSQDAQITLNLAPSGNVVGLFVRAGGLVGGGGGAGVGAGAGFGGGGAKGSGGGFGGRGFGGGTGRGGGDSNGGGAFGAGKAN